MFARGAASRHFFRHQLIPKCAPAVPVRGVLVIKNKKARKMTSKDYVKMELVQIYHRAGLPMVAENDGCSVGIGKCARKRERDVRSSEAFSTTLTGT